MNTRIFRKVSLDRLSSPEQLDQLLQVTSPRGWLALAASAVLLVGAIAWGVVGSIADKVQGQGILIRTGGVLEVTALTSGQVVDLPFRVGDLVETGQVIARVAQPELIRRIQEAKADLAVSVSDHARTLAFNGRDQDLRVAGLEQRKLALSEALAAGRQRLRWLEERLVAQEQLVGQGLITRQSLLNTRAELEGAREKVRTAEGDLQRTSVERLSLRNELEKSLAASQHAVEEKQRAVAQLESELESTSRVISSYTGRVLELVTEQGSVISRGEPILSLDLSGKAIQNLEAVVYVPAMQGKKIRPGMVIQITPATVRKEDYGVMLGRVTYVSDFPATSRGMGRVLKNDQLVTALSGAGAPYEVRADLLLDPSTPSRFRWSSSAGPPTEVRSGTLASASITVESRRPVAMVLPVLRRFSGF